MSVKTKIAVVILNWNGRHFLEKFLGKVLDSIFTSGTGEESKLFVADNASTDDSVEWLKANYPAV